MTQWYDDEFGIWTLNELVQNEKKDKEINSDLWYVLRHQCREVRESFSDFYFEGMDYYVNKNHPTHEDYVNCCLEEAINFAKEMYRR